MYDDPAKEMNRNGLDRRIFSSYVKGSREDTASKRTELSKASKTTKKSKRIEARKRMLDLAVKGLMENLKESFQ